MKSFSITPGIKQTLLGAVIGMLVLAPFSPLIAQADTLSADTTSIAGGYTAPTAATGVSSAAIQTTNTGSVNTSIGDSTGVTSPAATAGVASINSAVGTTNTNNQSATDPADCSWSPHDWDLCLTNVVYVFTVGIGSGFAYTAAEFFNLAVNLSLNGPIYALTFISTGWTTARDLANMAFLFILIYIAFTIMFGSETSGTMSLLAGVITIALLVNFSFFFTRLVIDAGNILSIQFYNSIQVTSIQQTAQSSNAASAVNTAASSITGTQTKPTKDLTSSIMGMLQLQNLFNSNSFTAFHAQAGFFTQIIVLCFLYIGAAIMFYLLTVMFVTVGIKFLVRIVILWFLIIFSPLAFVARAVPNFKKYFDQWRSLLISHAFYPVAFMFIFLILTNFTNQMGSCTNSGGASSQSCLINDIFTSLPSGATSSTGAMAVMGLAFANVAIRLGFVIAILYMGLKAADSVSVMGAGAASKAGNWVGGAFKASTLGLAARTGGYGAGTLWRNTGGRLAANASDAIAGSQWANRTGTLGGVLGYRLRRDVTEPLANTSLGTPASSFRERRSFLGTREREMNTNIRDRENLSAAERTAARGGTVPQTPQDHADENRIRRLNGRELETLSTDQLTSLAHLLSSGQIQTIDRSNHFDDAARERISAAWNTRGQRNNPLNGHFGSDDAAINRADRLLQEINTLQTTMGRVASNITTGTRVTSQTIRTAINDIQRQVVDPATAQHTVLQAQLTRSVADEAQARTAEQAARAAGNLVLAAQHLAEATRHQNERNQRQADMATVLTQVRNGNALIQNYTDLNTHRGNLTPDPSHHVNQNLPPPNRGEFDAR